MARDIASHSSESAYPLIGRGIPKFTFAPHGPPGLAGPPRPCLGIQSRAGCGGQNGGLWEGGQWSGSNGSGGPLAPVVMAAAAVMVECVGPGVVTAVLAPLWLWAGRLEVNHILFGFFSSAPP